MLPLIYLSAAAATVFAGIKLSQQEQKQQGVVAAFPGESRIPVAPVDGSIVCCEIYGGLDHTGIWVDGHIIELNGNGLIRAISPQRFLQDRSGQQIYLACGVSGQALASIEAAERAIEQVYSYSEYHLLNNNCHRFVAQTLLNRQVQISRFAQLNTLLSDCYEQAVCWQPIDF